MIRTRLAFTLIELLVVIGILGVLAAFLLPTLVQSRKSAMKRDCTNNLRQIGTMVHMYVDHYGSGRSYPPAAGQGFLNTLRNIPTPARSMAAGQNGLFVCKAYGTQPSPTAVDYRQPRPAGWGATRVSDGTCLPNYPIVCDRTNNHDPNANDDINVLLFTGTVSIVTNGTPEWTMAVSYTQ